MGATVKLRLLRACTRRYVTVALLATFCLAGVAEIADARTRCVGPAPGCAQTIQVAIDAAQDGDTIRVGRGTFAGGLTITKRIDLQGAGIAATTIRGGGPVVTIGDSSKAAQPAVSMADLTITGGVTHGDQYRAGGGGIFVWFGADFSQGATVSLERVMVAGNRVETTQSVPSDNAECPDGPCPFSMAQGGGIATFGSLRMTDSVVRDNTVGGVASDANGGGIASHLGTLSLTRSIVRHNRAIVAPPNGRFAEGGGVFVDSGALTVRASVISDNTAELTSELPVLADATLIDMVANGGGIHVGDGVPTTIDNSAITGNVASAYDPHGEPLAIDAALIVGHGPLTMRRTIMR